jgi:DnaJ-class molecular chaperone
LNADTALVFAAAQAKAIEVDKAFRILRDPEKRKMYDEQLNQVTTVITSPTRPQRPTKRYVNTVGHVSPRESIFKQWFARLSDNLSTFETPSMQDIVIFVLSLLFFVYMVSLFFK